VVVGSFANDYSNVCCGVCPLLEKVAAMKVQIHISPEMAARIMAEAAEQKLSQSQVVRNRLATIYGLPTCTARKGAWVPDPLLAHDFIPTGADI
jgi:hypothetical protein